MEKRATVARAQATELQCTYRTLCLGELPEFRRHLAAGQHNAALMHTVSDRLEHIAVDRVAFPIATRALSGSQNRFQVVEDEQAAPTSKQLDEQRNARSLTARQGVFGRQESERVAEPFVGWRCVPQTTPVHALELGSEGVC